VKGASRVSWLRIDDCYGEHPKLVGLSDRAFRLHTVALCYCARNLTDGVVSRRSTNVLAAILDKPIKQALVELVAGGLWAEVEGGFEIVGYLDWNPSATKVKAEREKAKQRMGKNRARRTGATADDVDYRAVYERDGGICRICEVRVDYDEAEFDHIVPISRGGEHVFDNLAATHRRCNRAKRTQGAEFARGFVRTQDEHSGSPPHPIQEHLRAVPKLATNSPEIGQQIDKSLRVSHG
jgi:hypothetical protein